ncbi:Spy/CpxP family protein refolding chaperone [Hymenobacter jeollabukensis]|uniref:Periplasmic heavy metal sensor n=1 Tax=Hymenobacter jeollabukensis TaxID=2025313 RepID=A0A5R8WL37_9BACT|nr:hypothetical protein [Hymenobacter jeollabukensis]TLM89385.1 hypothetical protein FDY95_20135 [Hymenobacter jeollabukensis]
MKKMLFLLTVATLSFASAQAQTTPPANGGYQGQGRGMGREQRTPEQRADMQTQRLTNQLSLTADQQPKVRAIFLAQANEVDAARAQMTPGSMDRDAMRQKMQEGRARYDEQLKAVLTPEQFTKYQTQREDRMERMGEMKDARKEGKAKAKKDKVKVKAS